MLHKNTQKRRNITLFAAFAIALGLFSCTKKNSDTAATSQFTGTWNGAGCVTQVAKWTQQTNNPATGRKGAMSFSIGNEVYMGGGTNKFDFWKFSPSANNWTHLADIPVHTRYRGMGVAFSINNKGYIGLGVDTATDELYRDLWEYDPTTNLWTEKAKMPTASRYGAFCFVINDVAYVGGGYDSTGTWFKDFWSFDPTADAWVRKTDVPVYIINAFAFSTGDSGYVSCGKQGYHEDTSTFMYNSITNTWARRAPFPGHFRQAGSAFVLDNQAYCGLGKAIGSANEFDDFYAYNWTTNTWSVAGAFPAGPNAHATATVCKGKAYLGTGTDIYNNLYTYWYQYTPIKNKETYTIAAGPSNFTLYMTAKIGNSDTCARDVQLLGTVSSNAMDNFSIANQTFVDRCGNTYTLSGSGTIINDSILITTVRTSPEGTTACLFKGKR